jgi:hypothetical protein
VVEEGDWCRRSRDPPGLAIRSDSVHGINTIKERGVGETTRSAGATRRAGRLAAAATTGLLAMTGCTLVDAAGPERSATPSPSPVIAMRVEKPEKLARHAAWMCR